MTQTTRQLACLPSLCLLAFFLSAPVWTGCSNRPSITVSAAASLTRIFQELGEGFETETGIRVAYNFGATGNLAQQIQHGAPVDLFVAADSASVEALAAEGHVQSGTERIYAVGRLTIWVRSGQALSELTDLRSPGIRRIAIANPDYAPYGAAAKQALATAGLWQELQPKLIIAANTRQALQYGDSGDADVVLLPLSLSLATGGHWTLVPETLYDPLHQMLAIPTRAAHPAEAQRFIDYLMGPEGQVLLVRYGLAIENRGASE